MATCVICGKEIKGYSNNAMPVCDGECCNTCNTLIVIPERIRLLTANELI